MCTSYCTNLHPRIYNGLHEFITFTDVVYEHTCMLITRLRIFVRGPLPDLYLTVSCPAHLHTPLGAPIHLAGGAQVEDGNNFGVSVQVPLPLSSTLFSRYPCLLAALCMTPGLSSLLPHLRVNAEAVLAAAGLHEAAACDGCLI